MHAHHKTHVATDVKAEEEEKKNANGAKYEVPNLTHVCVI